MSVWAPILLIAIGFFFGWVFGYVLRSPNRDCDCDCNEKDDEMATPATMREAIDKLIAGLAAAHKRDRDDAVAQARIDERAKVEAEFDSAETAVRNATPAELNLSGN